MSVNVLPPTLSSLIHLPSAEEVTLGESNARVFRVALIDSDRPAFLKISNSPYVKSEIEHEIKALSWLPTLNILCPKPLFFGNSATGDDGTFFYLMEALPGHTLKRFSGHRPSGVMTRDEIMTVGARLLSGLHRANINDESFANSLGSDVGFFRGLSVTLPLAKSAIDQGLVEESAFDQHNLGKSPLAIYNDLQKKSRTFKEDLVFCHGDYDLANIIYDPQSGSCGVIDLGRCGVADRYQDIALFLRGFGDDVNLDLFIREYGLISSVDTEKVRFFCDLDEFF